MDRADSGRTADRDARDFGATGQVDEGFVRRTYRSTLILAFVALVYLWSYANGRLVLPAAIGAALSLGLLYGNEVMVRRWLTPNRLPTRGNKKAKKARIPRREIALVLIKYLSAIILLWYIARNWDLLSIAAFIGGLCLVQVSIVTRALSRILIASWNQGT